MSGGRIYVRGEGGAVFPMDLPLPEPIADRLAAGQLIQVNRDGSPHKGGTADVQVAAGADGAGTDSPAAGRATARPAQAAPKSEWIGHVVSRGLLSREDAEAMTKADLIDLAGGEG
ncbi:hypothetical protein RM844_28720 [Streptomyces sp. DSM 44915]|uniref:Uncharacterized protein n=1 Tax=Streptomyces chisholmiae TaxID=3075540 RepID=A0ABU2JZR4_9ACTN|nr:hypothetical protein [Streptomyces sp. DSM 44915]MDT0270261.1 hypothetical protein [Streptomyces sp. DSM 44915]